jgi:transposase
MGRKEYSDEFKAAAVEQVVGQRHGVSEVARRLGVSVDSLRLWVDRARYNGEKSIIPADLPLEQKVRELEKENARLRMERDILKKATAYFAKESL